jgi:hypothetical protein
MYKVYKLTAPNGKVYIGTTKLEKLYDRWRYGNGYSANKPFYNDILTFGWDNIKKEVLEEVETKEEAHLREKEYILKYKSHEKEYGYNSHKNILGMAKKHTYVKCKETGELFYTMRLAGEYYGVSSAAISYAAKNNTPCVNRHWEKIALTKAEYDEYISKNF